MPDDTWQSTPVMRPSPILVLGLGNPILGDDGVGWRVAEQVNLSLGPSRKGVEVDWASLGGISLMERMLGYSHVIIIDSLTTGRHPIGYVSTFPLQDLHDPSSGHTSSAHDASLATALQTARAMGEAVPERIDIVAIETEASFDFSEKLSRAVEVAVPVATRMVMNSIAEIDR